MIPLYLWIRHLRDQNQEVDEQHNDRTMGRLKSVQVHGRAIANIKAAAAATGRHDRRIRFQFKSQIGLLAHQKKPRPRLLPHMILNPGNH